MQPKSTRMVALSTNSYPRKLREKERELLDSVLPVDRPGYKKYCDLIESMVVLAEGRRGKGNFVLGYEGDIADINSPLAPVIAYGILQATHDQFSITVRECVAEQIDCEIVSSRGEEVPDHFEEKRRWTYSTWLPNSPSPATGSPVRGVSIDANVVLAIAKEERRLWAYDSATGMNHLVPITNFYNELMLHKSIRDPKIALKSGLFFADCDKYTDAELRMSFIAYNKLKPKVQVSPVEPVLKERGLKLFVQNIFRKKR
jgi:hypothetical protein